MTCPSALLAMARFMFRTLVATGLANISAKRADLRSELTVAGHKGRRHPANIRAVQIERNAPGHLFYIVFPETGSCAVVASRRALITGFDTGCILVMCHGSALHSVAGQVVATKVASYPKQSMYRLRLRRVHVVLSGVTILTDPRLPCDGYVSVLHNHYSFVMIVSLSRQV